jgi:cytochrome d ubiquinol oxidase subunit II
MLLALVFRGVAFEFRWVAKPNHRKWDISFAAGSMVAAFAQGVMLGAILSGIKVSNHQFAGGPFDCFTPFTLMCGFGLIAGYALIGACWLQLKTSGEIEHRGKQLAGVFLIALFAFIALVSVWTPLEFERVAERWFSWPNLAYLAPVPIVTLALTLGCWHGIRAPRPPLAFFCAVGLFVMALLGILISTFPYIVPPHLTLWDATAAHESQVFLLAGTAVLLPVILGYTVFVYYTFRGKIKAGEGYH